MNEKNIIMNILKHECGIITGNVFEFQEEWMMYDSKCINVFEDALDYAIQKGWIRKNQVVR